MDKEIKCIYVDKEIGYIFATNGRIERYEVKGEMAMVDWYRQYRNDGSIAEYNGKYVIEVIYE